MKNTSIKIVSFALACLLLLDQPVFSQEGNSGPLLRSIPQRTSPSTSAPSNIVSSNVKNVRPSETAAPNTDLPYEKDLNRLSEIMGSLSFLRSLCNAKDAPDWLERIRLLLDSENTDSQKRERLVRSYNQGFQSFALTYRRCTPAAEMASHLYLQEGESLTRQIAGRFGG